MLALNINVPIGDTQINVECEIPPSVTALFGPSGCGKTTLLRAIAGLTPCSGSIRFKEEIWQGSDHLVPCHERRVGYVFQEDRLFPHLSVEENLRYGLKRADVQQVPIKLPLADVVEQFDLANLLGRKPKTLSGGESRRVNVARAILGQPQLLLLDEPLNGLDSQRKTEIIPYLANITRELDIPTIYVSHLNDEIAKLCDHMLVMGNNTLTQQGRTQDILPSLGLLSTKGDDLGEAGSVIQAAVTGFSEAYSMIDLAIGDQVMQVLGQQRPATERVRLFLAARDIAIATSKPTQLSIRNMLSVTITDIAPLTGQMRGLVAVHLTVNGSGERLCAHISKAACEALNLQLGAEVFALIKSARISTPA